MGKTDKKLNTNKQRRILIIGVAVLVVLGAGVAAYFLLITPMFKPADTTTPAGTTSYQDTLKQKTSKINALVTAGDSQSIQQANQIADSQVTAATQSGDEAYIVDASLAKAALLIETNRAQEAIDTILTPLDQKYGSNTTYKYAIYGYFSLAYRQLGDQTKADSYFNQIPGQGWN